MLDCTRLLGLANSAPRQVTASLVESSVPSRYESSHVHRSEQGACSAVHFSVPEELAPCASTAYLTSSTECIYKVLTLTEYNRTFLHRSVDHPTGKNLRALRPTLLMLQHSLI